MISGIKPLLSHDCQKQSSHDKVNAFGVENKQAANNATGNCTSKPIGVVKSRKIKGILVEPVS